jgi:hypothetical protein
MALIVFLRGINVGGHRRVRPSILARELREYDVMNVGAAGTLVVRNPGSRIKFLAELRRKLPLGSQVVVCVGRDLLRLKKGQAVRRGPITFGYRSIRQYSGESWSPKHFFADHRSRR